MSSIESRSPQDPSDLVGTAPDLDRPAVEAAVARARASAAGWAATPGPTRAALLEACANAVEAAAGELGALIVREVGKPAGEASAEVARGVAILRYHAQSAMLPLGEVLPAADGRSLLHTRRVPWGVAGLITPWNFPVAIPLWKAAPALAAGNTVVLKPSEQAPVTALRLGELLGAVLPADVLQVVTGTGTAGAAVAELTDVVSFTGSRATGVRVRDTVTARGVPVQCEMGGQNAALVLPDADQEAAATMIAAAAMGYAGQKCTATSRVVVVGDAEAFGRRLAAAVEALAVGDPTDTGTVVGPVIDTKARQAVLDAVAEARRDGQVLAGGQPLDRPGSFVAPTVVASLPAGARLLTEEVFGPVCAVQAARDVDHAVELVNDVRYGLVASIHTKDLAAALDLVPRLETGMVKVNAPTTGVDLHAPFGGDKDSSFGQREQGSAAAAFYSRTTTVTLSPG